MGDEMMENREPSLVNRIIQYKELLSVVGAAATVVGIVFSFFATSKALARVECRLENRIVIATANAEAARLERRLLDAEEKIRSLKGLKGSASDFIEKIQDSINAHERQREKIDKQVEEQTAISARAQENINSDKCDKEKEKKGDDK